MVSEIRLFLSRRLAAEREEMLRLCERGIRDLLLRAALILLGCIVFAYFFQMPAFLVWYTAYFANAIYDYLNMRRFLRVQTERTYALLLTSQLVEGFTSYGLLYILWFSGLAPLKLAAIIYLTGIVLFALTDRVKVARISGMDFSVVQVSLTCMWVSSLLAASDPNTNAALAIIIAGLQFYHAMSIRGIWRNVKEIQSARDRALQAQKMEAVGRLTGGIAHDFNNILTVILGNLDLYDEVSDPVERKGMINESRVAALRASELTSQLMAFSRQVPLKSVAFPVAELVEEVGAMVQRVLPAGITFSTKIDPTAGSLIVADRGYLSSALLNLVINARDALQGQGGISLCVCTPPAKDLCDAGLLGDRYIGLCVLDDGPGFEGETRDRAFDPFFTTKPVGQGSGLGLSMVKGFAEQSKGSAMVSNRRSGGANVRIILPCAQ